VKNIHYLGYWIVNFYNLHERKENKKKDWAFLRPVPNEEEVVTVTIIIVINKGFLFLIFIYVWLSAPFNNVSCSCKNKYLHAYLSIISIYVWLSASSNNVSCACKNKYLHAYDMLLDDALDLQI